MPIEDGKQQNDLSIPFLMAVLFDCIPSWHVDNGYEIDTLKAS